MRKPTQAMILKESLVADGWVSPDTYCNWFAPIERISAVYLFMRFEDEFYSRSLVGYVGMTTNLEQRMAGHEMLPLVGNNAHWVMRWFKPTPGRNLRRVEADYITRFNPPWNIVGRPRGIIQ